MDINTSLNFSTDLFNLSCTDAWFFKDSKDSSPSFFLICSLDKPSACNLFILCSLKSASSSDTFPICS
jgi:hypothetical protein